MTSEEREYYKECDSDVIYDCPLPENGQVVLITDKYGNVETDTFFKEDTCYFDCNDMEDVVAWRPLPTPYQKGE